MNVPKGDYKMIPLAVDIEKQYLSHSKTKVNKPQSCEFQSTDTVCQ